jgi:hypothetical protein
MDLFLHGNLVSCLCSSALPRRGVGGAARTAIECTPWELARETSNARSPGRKIFSIMRQVRTRLQMGPRLAVSIAINSIMREVILRY